MKRISSGEEFDCVYLKANGVLTEIKGLRKPTEGEVLKQPKTDRRRSARNLKSYLLLIPFITRNNQIRELYTRLIVIFNNEEVTL